MKVTAEQKYMLLQFIEGNENIAKNNLTNNFTAKDATKLWQDISFKLNACLGPVKTWKAWRKCWQDLKSTTKARAAAYSREGRQTGGGAPQVNEPDNFTKRVIALIGKNATHGHEDVQESPIIFGIEQQNPPDMHDPEGTNSNSGDPSDHYCFDRTPSSSKSPPTSAKAVATVIPSSNSPSTFIQNPSTSFTSPSIESTMPCTPHAALTQRTKPTTLKRTKLMQEKECKRNERDAHFFKAQDELVQLKKEKLALLKRKLEDEKEWRERVLEVKKIKVEELKMIRMYLEKLIKE